MITSFSFLQSSFLNIIKIIGSKFRCLWERYTLKRSGFKSHQLCKVSIHLAKYSPRKQFVPVQRYLMADSSKIYSEYRREPHDSFSLCISILPRQKDYIWGDKGLLNKVSLITLSRNVDFAGACCNLHHFCCALPVLVVRNNKPVFMKRTGLRLK